MNQPYATAKWTANTATLFLALFGVITIVSIVSTVVELGLLQRIDGKEFVSRADIADIAASDRRQTIIGVVYPLCFLFALVPFLGWMRRASENLAPLGAAGQRFSPGWAVGAWFVPIINLFRPYQIMAEIWRGSRPEIDPENPDAWTKFPASRLLGFWWAGWLLSGWIFTFAIRLFWSGDAEIDDLITAAQANIAGDLISLAALVLLVILLRRITANQDKKHALRQSLVAEGAIVDELELLAASSGAPLALCRNALRQGFDLQDAGETLEFRHTTHPPAIAREVLEREVLRRPLPMGVAGQPTPEGAVTFAVPKWFLAQDA